MQIKVWDITGRVSYSNNPRQVDRHFRIDHELRTALAGKRAMDVSNLTASENAGDRQGRSALLETYVPMRAAGRVIGAYEANSDLTALNAEVSESRQGAPLA